jgi:NADH-quinone oxidoreductase subunit L
MKTHLLWLLQKAFIVTRFADLGFLIGILILAFYSGTLDFGTLIERLTSARSPELINITSASFLGATMLTWALVLVFIGGAGKSAMFPCIYGCPTPWRVRRRFPR